MKILLAVTLLGLLAIASSLNSTNKMVIDYRLKYDSSGSPKAFTCKTQGLFCADCHKIVSCTGNGAPPVLQHACPQGEICNEATHTCMKPPTYPVCSPTNHLKFPCIKEGIFPNPGDCKRYHYCIRMNNGDYEEHPRTCTSSDAYFYGYNAKTTFCDKKLTNNLCTGFPVPLCTDKIKSGPVPNNPTLYYTCYLHEDDSSVYYPYISSCENGKKYTASSGCR